MGPLDKQLGVSWGCPTQKSIRNRPQTVYVRRSTKRQSRLCHMTLRATYNFLTGKSSTPSPRPQTHPLRPSSEPPPSFGVSEPSTPPPTLSRWMVKQKSTKLDRIIIQMHV